MPSFPVFGAEARRERRRSTALAKGFSTDDDFEGFEIIARRMRVILPQSLFRSTWDWVLICLVLYSLVMIPLEICFVFLPGPGLQAFNFIVDFLFIMDLVLNFRTAYYEGAGLAPVFEPRLIARHYIFGHAKKKGIGYVTTHFLPHLFRTHSPPHSPLSNPTRHTHTCRSHRRPTVRAYLVAVLHQVVLARSPRWYTLRLGARQRPGIRKVPFVLQDIARPSDWSPRQEAGPVHCCSGGAHPSSRPPPWRALI
jgi:hypothetical protein